MECELCGGTDFYKESGFFFCNECQTQSQEVREHEFQQEITNIKTVSKKIQQPPSDKSKNKITSWECYNIVIHSLTKELINLGANKKFKSIVKCLWMKYLEKLEVIHLDYDEMPKLQLINATRDARILYDQERKKRKRKKSTSDETSASEQSMNKILRNRSKKKRALVQAHYESFSQKSTQGSTSLHDETLTSLKSDSEKEGTSECCVKFNRYGVNELRKKVSRRHYRKHQLDKGQDLKCHKLTYKTLTHEYVKGVHFLSPQKIYCILYLGLLIARDKIQLGDLFRFIREGHLSFNNYTHLFPEDFSEKFISVQNYKKASLFTSESFRITAAKMATFLDIVKYIEVVDLTQLCQRYCTELNLPDEIFVAVKKFISRTHPKLTLTKKSKIIPNYEGRAVSIILFTIKLLFGLDGVTEFELSKYAQLVNDLNIDKPKMFDIIKWIEYIGYRNLVVSEYHFPYSYKQNSEEINSDLFLQYIKSRDIQLDDNIKLTKEMTDYNDVLMRIKELQHDENDHIEFPYSLTPFLDYAKIIESARRGLVGEVLRTSFDDNSLEFLLRPYKYLQLVGENLELKHGGANDNWIMEDIKSIRELRGVSMYNHKLIPVEILNSGCEKDIDEILSQDPKPKNTRDPLSVQTQYQECRKHIFEENDVFLKKVSNKVDLRENVATVNRSRYNIHFNPYERYWLYLKLNVEHISKAECEAFFDKYSHTFKLIFKECTRIIEQTEQELLREFQFSELYLVYATTYCDKSSKSDKTKLRKLLPDNISYFVTKSEACW